MSWLEDLKQDVSDSLRKYDWIIALVLTALAYTILWHFGLLGKLKDYLQTATNSITLYFYSSFATATCSLLGFVIAAVAVIIAFGSQLESAAKEGHLTKLFGVYKSTIWWLAVSVIVGFIGIVGGSHSGWAIPFATVVFFLSLQILFRMYQCVSLLMILSCQFADALIQKQDPHSDPDSSEAAEIVAPTQP